MSDINNAKKENDFSKGSIIGHMLRLAGPMTLAQLVNVLYNIIDRIFIGKIPNDATNALTGLGVAFPICTVTIGIWPTLLEWAGHLSFQLNEAKAMKMKPKSYSEIHFPFL